MIPGRDPKHKLEYERKTYLYCAGLILLDVMGWTYSVLTEHTTYGGTTPQTISRSDPYHAGRMSWEHSVALDATKAKQTIHDVCDQATLNALP